MHVPWGKVTTDDKTKPSHGLKNYFSWWNGINMGFLFVWVDGCVEEGKQILLCGQYLKWLMPSAGCERIIYTTKVTVNFQLLCSAFGQWLRSGEIWKHRLESDFNVVTAFKVFAKTVIAGGEKFILLTRSKHIHHSIWVSLTADVFVYSLVLWEIMLLVGQRVCLTSLTRKDTWE